MRIYTKVALSIFISYIIWFPVVTAKEYYFGDEEVKLLDSSSPEYSKKVLEVYRNMLKQKQPKAFQKIKHNDWLVFSIYGILNDDGPDILEKSYIDYYSGLDEIFTTTEKKYNELFELILWLEKNSFKLNSYMIYCLFRHNKSSLSLEQRIKILFSKTLLFKNDFNRYRILSAMIWLYGAPLFKKCRKDKTISSLFQQNLKKLNNTAYNNKNMYSKLHIFLVCLLCNLISDHEFLKKKITYFFNKYPDKDYIYRVVTTCTGVKVNDNKSFYRWLKNFNYSIEKDWRYNKKVCDENIKKAAQWGLSVP